MNVLEKEAKVLSYDDKSLLNVAYDGATFQKKAEKSRKTGDAYDYINLYLALISAKDRHLTQVPKFYIRDLSSEIQKLPKEHKKAIERFFGLAGGPKHYKRVCQLNNLALRAMYDAAVQAANYLQSMDSIYVWHQECHEVIHNVAQKVYDPKGKYTDAQKAKLAHVYYMYIRTFQFMYYDVDKKHLLSHQEKADESKFFGTADIIVQDWVDFFRDNVKDGDIIPEMVEYFISLLPDQIKKFVQEDCQLLENKFVCTVFGAIRFAKEDIFSHGEWLNDDCCTISGMTKLKFERVSDLSAISWLVYNSETWKGQHERLKKVVLPNQGVFDIKVQEFVGKRTFVDKTEALMFKKALDVLSTEYPELKFHGNTWASYGFNQRPSYLDF